MERKIETKIKSRASFYDLLEQTERAEIRFFWMLRRHRLTVIFLAKLETRFRQRFVVYLS